MLINDDYFESSQTAMAVPVSSDGRFEKASQAGIESCRKSRPDLMGNNYDNLVLVFITDDKEDVYTPYYEANQKGAESYRISHDDYLALCDMFAFSGIPHHEYITPEGKACTNVPDILPENASDRFADGLSPERVAVVIRMDTVRGAFVIFATG